MDLPETIELEINFGGKFCSGRYGDTHNCYIASALKEEGYKRVVCGSVTVEIGGIRGTDYEILDRKGSMENMQEHANKGKEADPYKVTLQKLTWS